MIPRDELAGIKPTIVTFRTARGQRVVGVVSAVKDTTDGVYLKVIELFFYIGGSHISRTDKGDTHFVAMDEESLRYANEKEMDDVE